MIKDRPAHLLADPDYCNRPAAPYAMDWSAVPELIRASIMDLGGIQPVTKSMITVAGGTIFDNPTEAEIAYFRERGTTFQMVSIIASVVDGGVVDGVQQVRPFALSLMPTSKRGKVDTVTIDHVALLKGGENWQAAEPCYSGYDPFEGGDYMYGLASVLLSGRRGFLDEVGLVVGTFFVASDYVPEEVLAINIGLPGGKATEKYRRKRSELLFSQFATTNARRVWGVETPIELFLMQELARHGLYPQPQILVMRDGGLFPSWYNLWQDMDFRHTPETLTEIDLYFPEQRLAVFCDGSHHDRRTQKLKDQRITDALAAMGIRSVRIEGRIINGDLGYAGRLVIEALRGGAPINSPNGSEA